jgi:alkylation response protein AidB-like acyl-CoA dehydrogenase
VPKQAGISLFLVDADSPGLTTSVHTSLAGNQSATSFWDDVFVPDDRLVGRAGEGWSALGAALASERVLIGSNAMRSLRLLERLVQILRSGHDVVAESRRERVAEDLGRVAVRLHAARALVNRAIRGVVTGTGTAAGAAMAKVAATELGEDLNATAVALLGPDALLKWGVEGAVGAGYFEDGLRASIMGVIAGGTGDIQRNIIARGIGLLNK